MKRQPAAHPVQHDLPGSVQTRIATYWPSSAFDGLAAYRTVLDVELVEPWDAPAQMAAIIAAVRAWCDRSELQLDTGGE